MASQKSTRELLDQYWAAETSPEDEKLLREQLSDTDDTIGIYFQFLKQESEQGMTREIPATKSGRIVGIRRVLSIAASVGILVTAGYLIQHQMIQQATPVVAGVDSYNDPMKAYEETRQALLFVSAKMNKSRKIANEQIQKTQPYIEILK